MPCKEETNMAVASMMTCKMGLIWCHIKTSICVKGFLDSNFNCRRQYQFFTKLPQITHTYKNCVLFLFLFCFYNICKEIDQSLLHYRFCGRNISCFFRKSIFYFCHFSCEPITVLIWSTFGGDFIFLHYSDSIWHALFIITVKGCRMGRSDKVSLWYVALLINTRFRFFILE